MSQYSFINQNDFKIYPIFNADKINVPCKDNNNKECKLFFASKSYLDLKPFQNEIKHLPLDNPNQVLIEGFSIRFIDLIQYKYFTVTGQKSLSLFKPKF